MGDLSLECNNIEASMEFFKKAHELCPSNREILIKLATISQTYFPDNIDETIDYYNSYFIIELEKNKTWPLTMFYNNYLILKIIHFRYNCSSDCNKAG